MRVQQPVRTGFGIAFALLLVLIVPACAGDQDAVPQVVLEIRDHLFYPDTVVIPAFTRVRLVIINRDNSAEEFESHALNREKVIPGGSTGVVFIGPLPPGEYPFFGEFFPRTAQGRVIAE